MNTPHPTVPDDHQLQGQRRQLVESLRKKGIRSEAVLSALNRVKRHAFIESALWPQAYKDIALQIGLEQTISQPYTVAYMTELLDLHPGDKVLEIGTGSGYQAAVLCELGAKVYSVERHRELSRTANEVLQRLGYNVRLKVGDGTRGWPMNAPYEGIIVTAAGPGIPRPLLEQMAIGGRMVIPVGDRNGQVMTLIIRRGEDDYERIPLEEFRFVPLIGEEGWRE